MVKDFSSLIFTNIAPGSKGGCGMSVLRILDVASDFRFIALTKGVAAFHKILDRQFLVHSIHCIGNKGAACFHIKKVRINTSALLSGKVGVDGTEPGIPHYGFHHHFAQDPFQRWTLIFLVAVSKQTVPNIEPQKMNDLMDALTDCAAWAVQIKYIKTMFF